MRNLEKEQWKRIYNSKNYFVSNLGNIKRGISYRWNPKNNSWSIYPEHIIKQSNNNSKGYWRVPITMKTGEKRLFAVHRLVAEYFKCNPNINTYLHVNHLDGNKDNNYWRNLQWCTNIMNMQHAKINNLRPKGKQQSDICHLRKLNEEQVKLIPQMLKTMKLQEIADYFQVGKTTISEIKAGRSWKHLNLDFS